MSLPIGMPKEVTEILQVFGIGPNKKATRNPFKKYLLNPFKKYLIWMEKTASNNKMRREAGKLLNRKLGRKEKIEDALLELSFHQLEMLRGKMIPYFSKGVPVELMQIMKKTTLEV